MAKSVVFFLASIVLLLQITQPARAGNEGTIKDAYKIQPGDVLEISVWKEENLQKVVLVRPDGEISLPLVNEIQAEGKTVAELRDIITVHLEKFSPDPVVSVTTQLLNGNKVYVIGQVRNPGEIVRNTYLDVLQALSIAGGMTPFASVNKIKILRRENGQLISIPFSYGDLEKGKELEQNIILKGGDVIVVP